MNPFVTALIALLVFGFLIFIHEFGHYIFARIFGVAIKEFSIGMGPKLVWYDSKKTGITYKVCALPIGGYVAMEGEDGESSDPNSFDKKPAWQRFIVTAAGAFVNILFGFLAMIILASMINIGGTTVRVFADKELNNLEVSSQDAGLMVGDEIIKVGDKRVSIYDELSYEIMRGGNEPLTLTVIRDGKEEIIENVVFPTLTESGQTFGLQDFGVHKKDKNILTVLDYSFQKSMLTVRMCWESIYDLITGRYTLGAVSGPIGISSAIGTAASDGLASLLNIVVLISINLGVMNLLPIPALDGGRLLTVLFEMITRKRIPPKVEGIVNGVGLILLLGLSVVIMVKDVFQLIL